MLTLYRVRIVFRIIQHVKLKKSVTVILDYVTLSIFWATLTFVLSVFVQVDILVNNAGRSQRALLMDTLLEVDQEILKLNVLGTLSLTKVVLPHMFDRKSGHVVVTSSVAGKLG